MPVYRVYSKVQKYSRALEIKNEERNRSENIDMGTPFLIMA